MATLEKEEFEKLVIEVITKIRDYIYSGEVHTKTSRRADIKEIVNKYADRDNENSND